MTAQATFGVALILFLVVLAFTLYVWLGPYRLEGKKARRYRLFAVRDRLIGLVADNVLREEDCVFQYLYHGVNRVIPAAKPLSLQDTVNLLKASHLVDVEQTLFIKHRILDHADPRVRELVLDLFSAIVDVLLMRSLFVRAARIGLTGYRYTHQLRQACGSVFRVQNEAYEIYRTVGAMVQALNTA